MTEKIYLKRWLEFKPYDGQRTKLPTKTVTSPMMLKSIPKARLLKLCTRPMESSWGSKRMMRRMKIKIVTDIKGNAKQGRALCAAFISSHIKMKDYDNGLIKGLKFIPEHSY